MTQELFDAARSELVRQADGHDHEIAARREEIAEHAQDVFVADKGVDAVIAKVKHEVANTPGADISTPAGRQVIRSTAYKIARTKSLLDDLGKNLVADLKKQTGAVDADRRRIRDELDALQEAAEEKARQDRAAIEAKARQEREQAERARLAEVERVAREMAEAQKRYDDAKREREAAEERTRQAEIARKAEADTAERYRIVAAERAERDRQQAIEDERARVAAEEEAMRAATAAREADRKHKGAIHSGAADALLASVVGINTDQARAIVIAIAGGLIPGVRIHY